jgi:hypothetical protein
MVTTSAAAVEVTNTHAASMEAASAPKSAAAITTLSRMSDNRHGDQIEPSVDFRNPASAPA